MMFARLVSLLVLLSSCHSAEIPRRSIKEDLLPSICKYEDVKGDWIFDVAEAGHDRDIDCTETGKIVRKFRVSLDLPNVARDEFGNVGSWTLVNSGLHVTIGGREFSAFVSMLVDVPGGDGEAMTLCNLTMEGFSHDGFERDYACFFGHQVSTTPSAPRTQDDLTKTDVRSADNDLTKRELQRRLYKTELDMVDSINAAQSSWTAAHYDEYDAMTVDELLSRAGNRLQRKNSIVAPAPITKEQEKMIAGLPDAFDWRNVKGSNYVSPVRDQGLGCDSSYAFALTAMNEARLAVFTNRTVQVVFSPQDVLDCSIYAFGCIGGNSYTTASRDAEDLEMVEESCNPYMGVEHKSCGTRTDCKRYYFTRYQHIEEDYGASTEAEIMFALVNHGPLVVTIKVNEDLLFYKSGIYSPTGISSKFNSFVEVDHAVTLVGYGVDKTHGKYWIIKNSWGTKWGNNGYFYLRRGINECGVESDAGQSFPIV